MNKLIGSAVASSRLGIFSQIIENQFSGVDLTGMMIYLVDIVDKSALPWLAEQFGVEDFKGYKWCTTDTQRRELIKNAISLHKLVGTIAGIKKACSLIGFSNPTIEENVPVVSGGPNIWCAFRIRLEPDNLGNFKGDTLTNLKIFIDYYKNARSILTEIYFETLMEDAIFTSQEASRESLTIVGTIATVGDFSLDYGYDYF